MWLACYCWTGEPEKYVMEVSGGKQQEHDTKFCFVDIGDQSGTEFVELGVRI